MLSVTFYYCYAECHYAECRVAGSKAAAGLKPWVSGSVVECSIPCATATALLLNDKR
jgi:hypothetical protein